MELEEDQKPSKSDLEIVQCYHCCEMFHSSAIESHMRTEHGRYSNNMFGEQRPFQCPNCKCALTKEPKEDIHVCKPYFYERRKKSKTPIKCKICEREFDRQQTLFTHMATAHSEERNFACNFCDFKAKISVVLKRHIKRKHDKELNFVCELCGKKFFEAYRLRLHEESHNHKERKKRTEKVLQELNCDICEKTFLGQQALNVHMAVSHKIPQENVENIKKVWTCDKCGKNFTSAKYLNDHCNQEHPSVEKINSVESSCENCDLNFVTAVELNQHLESCLKVEEMKNLTCEKCESSNWRSAKALRKHIAEVHGQIVTICDICGTCLKSKYYLEDHKKSVHEGLKRFACSYCGKLFASKSTLSGHIGRMHETVARKYKCDKCDFTCLEPNKLKIHEDAVHVKSVRYECHLCKYFSFRKTGLQNHIKVVHEKYRPHKCDICDMAFTYKRDKVKHMSKH